MMGEGSVPQREPMAGHAVTINAYDTLACVRCNVTILLLKVPAGAVRPKCCGRAMRIVRPAPCSTPPTRGTGAGTLAGRCYVDESRGLVVRCTHSGRGVISYDSEPMTPLPD